KLDENSLLEAVKEMLKVMLSRHSEIESNMEEHLTQLDSKESIAVAISSDPSLAAANSPTEETKETKEAAPANVPQTSLITPFQVGSSNNILLLYVLLLLLLAYQRNDIDWRNAFKDGIRQLFGIEPPPDEEPIPEWWLDRNAERRAHVQQIVVRDNWVEKQETEAPVLSKNADDYVDVEVFNESEEVHMNAVYLDRVLARPVEDTMRRLYIPMKLNDEEKLDNYHILAT
ncbi:hypothetical protein RFI_38981, partial [Reticulomyxa filosa]